MDSRNDTSLQGGAVHVLGWLRRIEVAVAVVTISACGALLIADVLGREVLGQGIPWAQRVAVYCTTIAGMLGFLLVIDKGEHLRPKWLDGLFPKAATPVLLRVADLVSAGICLFLALYAMRFVHESFVAGPRGVALDIAVWPMQIILPYAFASAAARYLAYAAVPGLRPPENDDAQVEG